MKIVVQGSDGDAWWELINEFGVCIAVSFKTYSRKADAKRGAQRFIGAMNDAFYYAPFEAIKLEEKKR